jgi:hypothetical protein
MVAQRLMTEDEKFRTQLQAVELRHAGKVAEAKVLERTIPIQPWAAEFIKKYLGLDALLTAGVNLAEAEQKYGREWLVR